MRRFLELPIEFNSKVVNSLKRITLKKNTPIFREGETFSAIYLIKSGYIRRTISDGVSREVLISIAGPDETIGELAVFNNQKYVVSTTTLGVVTLLSLDTKDYLWLLDNCKEFSEKTNLHLYKQLLILNSRIKQLSADTIELRLKRFFVYLINDFGIHEQDRIIIPFRLSRAELAQAVNTTVETATRIMNKWQKEQLVSNVKGQFILALKFLNA